jgi:tetratricopeptide (TPR) repeat protein
MPYIDGESLRQRIRREGRLPVADGLSITRVVASALGYAHQCGIIHRDIKPENILLYQGEPMVADFGIAFAGAAAATERLTETGFSLGTPHYMSPEQVIGDLELDGRSDQYALACVVYEMLTGEPPFTGPTAQAVIARRFTESAPRITALREVPPGIDAALSKALARLPENRFPTVTAFASALDGSYVGQPSTRSIQSATHHRRRRISVLAVGVALAAAAVLGRQYVRGSAALGTDANLIAVLPFRVAGADQSLHYLREGMIDLLGAKLTGEHGPRAVDPRAVVNAWRDELGSGRDDLSSEGMLSLARRLGAGQVLLGEVVGTRSRLVLNARTLAVRDGNQLVQASVEGLPDSLGSLVDRLTSQLLARGARPAGQTLADLTSTSLPAVRAYLNGQAAYRRGAFAVANRHFTDALDRDSTFALAGLSQAATDLWLGTFSTRAREVIWAGREKLSPRDHALAIAYAGPRFPAATPLAEDLAAWLRAVAVAPDRPEAWFHAGDRYFHFGAVLGLSDSDEQAEAHFRRALDLDPHAEAPLAHLVELAAIRGDTAQAAQLTARFLGIDSTGDVAGFIRWRVAVARRDTATRRAVRAEFPSLSVGSLLRIVQSSQEMGLALEDADEAAGELRRRSGTPAERKQVLLSLASLFLNRGRPRQHLEITEALRRVDPIAREYLRLRVSGALYAGGDTAAGRKAISQLAITADGPLRAGSASRYEQNADICVVGLWRVSRGDLNGLDRALVRLRAPIPHGDSGAATLVGMGCAAVLAAKAAVEHGRGDPGSALHQLDSLLLAGVPMPLGVSENLTAARLHAARRDLPAALAAVRRRARWTTFPADYLPSYLREEGRLAAVLGDQSGAIRAYRHYLALLSAPEPSIAHQVEEVRGELAELIGRMEVTRQ